MVKLEDVCKSYGGAQPVPVLDSIDFTVSDGGFAAVLGASGSGKTTLLNILGCLDRPDGGSCEICGVQTVGMSAARLAAMRRECIGFVFQSYNLLPELTARQNVELALKYKNVESCRRAVFADAALKRVGLGDRADFYPGQLSGGQQQRAAVARAVAASPKLLLADEPTGNLDGESAASLLQLFSQLNRTGMTIVMITHSYKAAASAKELYLLREGRLERFGGGVFGQQRSADKTVVFS